MITRKMRTGNKNQRSKTNTTQMYRHNIQRKKGQLKCGVLHVT